MEVSDRQKLILSSMRVLTLLFGFKNKSSFNMSFDKIILFDFYMKYPVTMFGNSMRYENYDFEELYSYYHAQPDRDSYYQILTYLRSKELVHREIKKGAYVYLISGKGIEVIKNFENEYAIELIRLSNKVAKNVSKLGEFDLRNQILEKTARNIQKSTF